MCNTIQNSYTNESEGLPPDVLISNIEPMYEAELTSMKDVMIGSFTYFTAYNSLQRFMEESSSESSNCSILR